MSDEKRKYLGAGLVNAINILRTFGHDGEADWIVEAARHIEALEAIVGKPDKDHDAIDQLRERVGCGFWSIATGPSCFVVSIIGVGEEGEGNAATIHEAIAAALSSLSTARDGKGDK